MQDIISKSALKGQSEELRKSTKAMENPVVDHIEPSTGEKVKVLNQDIDLSQYEINFTPGNGILACSIRTPRMTMRPILFNPEDPESIADLEFLTAMYMDWATQKNYANGELKNDTDAEARLKFFDKWTRQGSPFTGYMATCNVSGKRIGIFNVGGSDVGPTAAECAAMLESCKRGAHYGTEGMIALILATVELKKKGFTMRDGNEYKSLTFSSRLATKYIAEKFELTATGTSDKYGKDPRDLRTVINEPVTKIEKLIADTKRAAPRSKL